jgi:hypothetical protein
MMNPTNKPLHRATMLRSGMNPDHLSLMHVHRSDLLAFLAYADHYAQDHADLHGAYAAALADRLRQCLRTIPHQDPDHDATVYDAIMDQVRGPVQILERITDPVADTGSQPAIGRDPSMPQAQPVLP